MLATAFAVSVALHTTQVPVFTGGEGGYVGFRIPGILATQGVLLATAEGRKYSCSDYNGQHDIVLKRSEDGGRSWSPLIVIADPLKLFGATLCGQVKGPGYMCEFWDPPVH